MTVTEIYERGVKVKAYYLYFEGSRVNFVTIFEDDKQQDLTGPLDYVVEVVNELITEGILPDDLSRFHGKAE